VLDWTPREANEEADALSNFRFQGFALEHRVHIDLTTLPFKVLPSLLKDADHYYRVEVPRAQAGKAANKGSRGLRPGEKLRDTDPW